VVGGLEEPDRQERQNCSQAMRSTLVIVASLVVLLHEANGRQVKLGTRLDELKKDQQLSLLSAAQERDYELAADKTFASASILLDELNRDMLRLQNFLPSASANKSVGLVQLNALEPKPPALDFGAVSEQMDHLGAAQMPAMMSLMDGMYESYKGKITESTKQEKMQKSHYDDTIQALEAKKTGVSDAGCLDTYNRIEKYWTRQRSISHHQYHTALKIMHSGMEKFKSISAAMADAIAGKKQSSKNARALGLAPPDVVFLQVTDMVTWAKDSSVLINEAMAGSSK